MKLLFLVKTYHDADKFFEKKISSIKDKNYKEINKIFSDFYCNWLSEFYIKLEENYDCEVIFPNNIELIESIKCKQTKKKYFEYLNYIFNDFKPDILISNTESQNFITKINLKNSYKILWKSSKITKNDLIFKENLFNHILSDNEEIINITNSNTVKGSLLLISVPDRILNYTEFNTRESKTFFTGSLGLEYVDRKEILYALLKSNINLEIRSRDLKEYKNYIGKIIDKILSILFKKKRLSYHSKNPFYGIELFKYMGQFKYILNTHSDFDKNNAINLRVFESLSQGCLLFTDQNLKMDKYFKKNEHLIVYRNKQDLIEKIRFYEMNQDLASNISKNGFDQIKKKHTTSIRIKEFKKILKI